jgi:hypothetical protein
MVIRRDFLHPLPAFEADYNERAEEGRQRLATSKVALVGLARNCGQALDQNLQRAERLASACKEWCLHVESNDCTDNTLKVLAEFCRRHPQATFHYQQLGREQFGAEFAGRRTIALAEYRDACQRWVQACASDADYVVVIDWDAWGGWTHEGVLNSVGWLVELQSAYGMASVSLFQHNWGNGPQWAHYDLWALRGVGQADCYWDTYRNGYGGFGYSWLPPVGSPPVLVSSAFGGMCVYRTEGFLKGTYDGTSDCEHVPLHESIRKATGQMLYLNPSQRTVMHWLPDEATDGGQHSND